MFQKVQLSKGDIMLYIAYFLIRLAIINPIIGSIVSITSVASASRDADAITNRICFPYSPDVFRSGWHSNPIIHAARIVCTFILYRSTLSTGMFSAVYFMFMIGIALYLFEKILTLDRIYNKWMYHLNMVNLSFAIESTVAAFFIPTGVPLLDTLFHYDVIAALIVCMIGGVVDIMVWLHTKHAT